MDPAQSYLIASNDGLHGQMIIDGLGVGRSADSATEIKGRQWQRVCLHGRQIGRAHIRVATEVSIPGLQRETNTNVVIKVYIEMHTGSRKGVQ